MHLSILSLIWLPSKLWYILNMITNKLLREHGYTDKNNPYRSYMGRHAVDRNPATLLIYSWKSARPTLSPFKLKIIFHNDTLAQHIGHKFVYGWNINIRILPKDSSRISTTSKKKTYFNLGQATEKQSNANPNSFVIISTRFRPSAHGSLAFSLWRIDCT